ncbi:MAG: hypothetical protein EXS35_00800 [Pedosphaera sp.]|nr:hypothetical protein [Pedosphaera sp.]
MMMRKWLTILATVLLLGEITGANAANKTWNGGGGDNNWQTGGDWGGTAPSAGDSLFFGGSTRLTTTNNFAANTSFVGLTFNSGAGAFTLWGNAINLGGGITNSSTSLQTINLNLVLTGTRTINSASGDISIGGVISETGGTFGITKVGTGTLTLSGANSYSGDTTISAGTLKLGASSVFANGSGKGNVIVNGTFDLNGFNDTINALSGSGTVDNTAAGTSTFTVEDNNTTSTFSGVVKNTGGALTLSKIGTGTLTLSGANTYSGGTTISAGTLLIGNTSALGTGSVTLTGGTLELNGNNISIANLSGTGGSVNEKNNTTSSTITAGSDNTSTTYSGTFGTVGGNSNTKITLIKSGTGTLTLDTGNNSGTDKSMTVNAGVLRINLANSLGGGNLNLNGGVLGLGVADFTRSLGTGNGQVQFGGSGGFAAYTADRNVNLGGAAAAVTWGSGSFVPTGSTLILGASDADKTVTFQNPISFANTGRTIQVDDGSASVDAVLSGILSSSGSSGGFTKTGNGTLSLTAVNTYTGPTTINAGTVQADNASAFGTSAITVNSATLKINNVSITADNLTLNNGATLLGTGAGASYSKSSYPSIASGASVTFSTSASTDVLSISSAIRNGNSSSLITVNGPGTVAVSSGATAADAFAGSWKITAGTLRLTDANALGNPGSTSQRPIELAGGTLDLRVTTGSTFSTNTTVSANALVLANRGSSGAGVTHNLGTLSIGANTLSIGPGGNVTSGTEGLTFGATTLSGNATFEVTNSASAAMQVTLVAVGETGGTRSLTKTGNGTLILGTASTYSGDTTISAGTLKLGAANVIPDGSGNGNLTANGTLDLAGFSETLNGLSGSGIVDNTSASAVSFAAGNNNQSSTFSGVIKNTGGGALALTKTGSGTLTLSGANLYGGVTTVSGGILSVNTLANGGSTSAIGNSANSAANLVIDGGTVQYTGGAVSSDRLFTVGTGGATIDASGSGALNLTSSGALAFSGTGTRSLTFAGSNTGDNTLAAIIGDQGANATALVKNGAGTWLLSGNNTFTGGLTINAGVVKLGNAGALNSTTPNAVAMTGGTLRLNGNSVTLSGLSGSAGTVENNLAGTATLTLNKTSGSDTFSGTIQDGASGTLALSKTGSGTAVLGAANSYSGGTTLGTGTANSGGTLTLGANDALGTGGLTFAGGILSANNKTDSTIGALSLTANSTLALVNDATHGSLTFTTISGTATGILTITGWAGAAGAAGTDDRIFFSGTAPDSTFLGHIQFDLSGTLYYSGMNGTELVPSLVPVPEPTEWALIIFATLAVFYKFVLPRLRQWRTAHA